MTGRQLRAWLICSRAVRTRAPMTARPVVNRARLALLLGGLAMFGPFAIDTIFPAFPAMERDFAIGAVAMQQSISVYLVAYAVMKRDRSARRARPEDVLPPR